MAVTITDTRVVVNEADATGSWSASDGVSVFTSAPDPVEASGSLGQQVSNSLEDAYVSITAANLTDTVVYCWLLPGGVLDDSVGTSSGDAGIQIYLGDGTNNIGFAVGGSDGAGFRHDDGPVLWQCFAIDTAALPATTTTFNGTPGNLNLNSITRIGNAFRTLVKSVGGVENCFMDILYYGNGGLIITGGGTGTEGKFLEIAQRDRSEADHPGQNVASSTGGAYGICREIGTDSFGLQGQLTFGSTGTASVDFDDSDVSVAFEDRGFSTNKYGLTVTGNGTGTTSVVWNNNIFNTPIGVGAFFTASSANINTLTIAGCTFLNFDQTFTFASTGTTGHSITGTSFSGCAQVVIGTTTFQDNSIIGSVATGTTSGAVLIESTSDVSGLSFTQGTGGHAVEIANSTNSPFTFTDFNFTGYAGTDGGTGNEAIVNTSGNPITINITGGSGFPSVDTTNSTGTVTIVNNVNNTVTVVDADTNAIQGAVVAVYNSGNDTEIANDETDVNGEINFSSSANIPVYIRVRKSTSGSTRFIPVETVGNTGASGLGVTVTLIEDEIASA